AAERRSTPARRGEQLVPGRVVYRARKRAARVGAADAHAPVRLPVEVIDRPVQRVDEPADAAPALVPEALLGAERVVRPAPLHDRDDRLLRALVGLRDEIGQSRLAA